MDTRRTRPRVERLLMLCAIVSIAAGLVGVNLRDGEPGEVAPRPAQEAFAPGMPRPQAAPLRVFKAPAELTSAASTQAAASIHGVVLDVTGGVVVGAHIRAQGSGEDAGDLGAETDANGEFTLHHAPGPVLLQVSAEGYTSLERRVEAPAAQLQLELSPAARLFGHVLRAEDKQPLAGVRVDALKHASASSAADRAQAVSDAHGYFSIEGLSSGTYELTARAEHRYGRLAATTVFVAEATGPVQILAGSATSVRGRVLTEATRKPCGEGYVTLTSGGRQEHAFAARAAIQSDGAVAFTHVPAGTFAVEVSCTGQLAAREYPRLQVGAEDIEDVTWLVSSGGRLVGTVVDPTGRGVPDRAVIVVADDGAATPDAGTGASDGIAHEARSNERGEFEIGGLVAGSYRAELADNPSTFAQVNVAAGAEPARVRLVLSGAEELRISIASLSGPRLESLSVTVRGQDGERRAQTVGNAEFLARDLSAGAYTIELRHGSNPPSTHEVFVRGGTTRISVQLPEATATLRGHVVDPSGEPVSDAWVRATASGDPLSALSAKTVVLTDLNGRFELAHMLPHASYDLEVSQPMHERVVVRAIKADAPVTVTMPAPRDVSARPQPRASRP